MSTKSERLQALVSMYQEAGQKWPATMREVAQWAVSTGKWAPQPSAIVSQCAEELSRALRDEYVRDAQGRRVRTKHAVTYKKGSEQFVLWDDIRTASHDHMKLAFQQRRQQILGDCKQLKNDADSYNENRSADFPIQIVFDFSIDLEESSLLKKRVA
ncbi:hypothetical protein [Herbaspirillum rubrisubalbicans]|uniref:Uncharacterized protein n=1 Tax=Herbaspirillum rubrisubalbicans TaxID=80842 RepID=A0ABX9C4V1_9BURK|nr:hypothetical protein [Herbaspirillum rubrisubalbicans]RAM65497.1 hypothetical protein RB24_07370 [Herbaspirillum rubrisubalbicans]